ncbi:tautomerase family protein [Arthrobacter sp. ZGTC412]|uniref:tautomerase family protein n=1 Tax=Arthrobacter sp. ZGTC412 TaxID=2058900 RepID=UPI000CE4098A|nr:tautomerase family protein [Arthrobacter sp. ZGTC412]
MPLVRIDLVEGRTTDQTRELADAIHQAIVETYRIPERDRFQIITEHPAQHIIAQDAGLGFERTTNVVIIHIFTQRGRSDEDKQALYKAVHDNLVVTGLAPEDIFVGYTENGPQDWSFSHGQAQYLTGQLQVPAQT